MESICCKVASGCCVESSTGASPPLKVKVPLKFCGEVLSSVCKRARTPNFQVCALRTLVVLFCSSKLVCLSKLCPTSEPPEVKDPRTCTLGLSESASICSAL